MNLRQFYLLKLAEESVEVSQRAIKQMQFGADEVQTGQEKSNAERLLEELIDLATVASLLLDIGEIPSTTAVYREAMRQKKLAKLEKYLKYSQELGNVQHEDRSTVI
jgi:hypothetical protein